jgi:hypothetical protein
MEPDAAAMAAQLRRLTHAARNQHEYASACFFGDKLVTLTAGAPDALAAAAVPATNLAAKHASVGAEDAFLLADCYFRAGEFGRAYRVLEARGLVAPPPRAAPAATGAAGAGAAAAAPVHALKFFHLGALCLRGMKSWDK